MRRFFIYILFFATVMSARSQSQYFEQARECVNNDDYEKAISLQSKGVKLLEKNPGKNSIPYVKALYDLAIYKSYVGRSDEADVLFNQIESTPITPVSSDLDENYDYYEIMDLMAQYYETDFDYPHAIAIRTKLIKFMEQMGWGKDALDYFGVLCQLNKDYIDSGNFKEALALSLEMLDTYEKMYKTSPENNKSLYATSLVNLAETYSYLGNYDKSIELTNKALPLVEDEGVESQCILLNNLANYYDETDRTEDAVEIQSKILKLMSGVLTEDDEYYIAANALMGRYLIHAGKQEEGLPYVLRAKNLWRKYHDVNHPYYQHINSTLVSAYCEAGKYEKAVSLSESIGECYQQIYGKNHPFFFQNSLDLITLYILSNNHDKLKGVVTDIVPLMSDNIRYNFAYLPRDARAKFRSRNKLLLEEVIPILNYRYPDMGISGSGYDACLFSKGILLNAERSMDDFVAETGSEELKNLLTEIKVSRKNLSSLYSVPIEDREIDADSYRKNLFDKELRLMDEMMKYGDYTGAISSTWDKVRDNLKEKDLAIEFVAFTIGGSKRYMGYLLKKDWETPVLVDLYEESELARFDNPDAYKSKETGRVIWGKLLPYLKGVENIYFAPDGQLNQIAIEYLPAPEGEGLMSEQFNLYRLSSTRELTLNKKNVAGTDAVVYGGILYDADVAAMETESRRYDGGVSQRSCPEEELLDSLGSRGSVGYLKNTLTEADSISKMMRDRGLSAMLLTGASASEESIKNLSGHRKGLIHIATHGFYWSGSRVEYEAERNGKLGFMLDLGQRDVRNAEDKALTRSGLYMAGANNILRGKELPESIEDGILTAQEIANLDLRGLDLVVLSACQTGMGDISSDGVFGLQRGFKKAGANTILMSLWDVDDEATELLMTEFYKNYLSGMSKQKSLTEAQRSVRENLRFKNPKYWAAFILLDAL